MRRSICPPIRPATAPATTAPAATDASANVTVTTNSVTTETSRSGRHRDRRPGDDGSARPGAQPQPRRPRTTEVVTTTNAEPVAPAAVVIPTIVMDEVPLTDAIKNLARQAGLNYILDPKVSFGPHGRRTAKWLSRIFPSAGKM